MPSKLVLRPEQPVSPIITAGQKILHGKRGVAFNALATHERVLWTSPKVNCPVRTIDLFEASGSGRN